MSSTGEIKTAAGTTFVGIYRVARPPTFVGQFEGMMSKYASKWSRR